MTGIREMFAELSGPDEFAQQVQLELFAWREREARREYNLWWQRGAHKRKLRTSPDWADRRRETNRAAVARYKRSRMTDPAWAERQREKHREYSSRYRAKKAAERSRAA